MKKLLPGLLILVASIAFAQQPSGMLPVTANRIIRGSGVPSSGTCSNAAAVGKVYIRTNAAATQSSFYVCANTASMTYAWELGGGGSGTGCTPGGSTNVLQKNNGSGGCAASSVTDDGTTVSTAEPISSTAGFKSGSAPPALTTGTGGVPFACAEGTVPTVGATAGVDVLYCDAATHQPLLSVNGGAYLPLIVGAQYKTFSCQPGLGDGLNAMTAATYLESTCWNKTGVTFTITGIQCFTDNAGSSTLAVTNGAGTALLTGAVTCSSTIASGTQSGTTTIVNNDFIKFTFIADGMSKQTTWVIAGTY